MTFNKFRVCFFVASATRKKACVSCLVGPRSSELKDHYIYDLEIGSVVSCRSYLLGKGTFVKLRRAVPVSTNVTTTLK